ncbi:oxytocin receptor isoform X1 [Oryzias latipes]|uniref:Isotocin receptor 2 n=2 Tax=Oryzias latipes TaxID=8090 RepID=H1ADE9_ORYLA|nr:oxytocin receptor [Oryzias latipes]XP_023810423.1 oxytocin receptor isoform X1 [Oryzias latipes]BAL45627.1 isotocin receptor 2 [Oryzias latipes]
MEIISNESEIWQFNGSWRNSSLGNGTGALNQTNPLKRNEEVAKVEVTVLALVLFLALAGNLCVLLAIHTTKHSQSRMYYFMKHLSIADLVVAIFQVLPQLIWDITFRFYGPDILCRLVKYLQVVGMFASTYMLVLMSIDRCLAICQPLHSLHRRKDRIYVILSWLLSLIFSIPQMFIFSLREVGSAGSGVYDCWGDFVKPWGAKAYITWISLTIYIIPVAILSICYGLISFKIWQNFKLKTKREQCINLTPKTSQNNTLARVSSVKLISKAKITTVKMTFVIVVAYIVCWTPFFSVQMWSAWDQAAPREAMPFIISMLLASLNSCCNPWIYMCFAGHLFHDLRQNLLCCSTRYLKSPECRCERDFNSSHKSNSSNFAIKSTSSSRSITQTSTT